MRLFVTGATGYVGSRLVCALLGAGHDIVAASRDAGSLRRFGWHDRVTVIDMDADDPVSTRHAFVTAGPVDALYYLVHGIDRPGFGGGDIRAAQNVALAAREVGVGRIVYLGGFVPPGPREQLSPHLRSRAAVADALALPDGPELVWLRAAVILGAGSTSFEIMRYLADRLAVVPEPGWTGNAMDPISIRDVLHYLVAAAESQVPAGAYDIAGPDVGTRYRSVLTEYLRAIGQPRLRIPLPHVSTRLAGEVAGRIVPVPTALTANLLTSLTRPMNSSEQSIRAIVDDPDGGLVPMRTAVELAVRTPPPRPVCELADVHHLADTDPAWAGGDLMRLRRRVGSVVGFAARATRGVVSLLSP
ncbi:NAD(P)H-binding protein [Gordonia sinesedis]